MAESRLPVNAIRPNGCCLSRFQGSPICHQLRPLGSMNLHAAAAKPPDGYARFSNSPERFQLMRSRERELRFEDRAMSFRVAAGLSS